MCMLCIQTRGGELETVVRCVCCVFRLVVGSWRLWLGMWCIQTRRGELEAVVRRVCCVFRLVKGSWRQWLSVYVVYSDTSWRVGGCG